MTDTTTTEEVQLDFLEEEQTQCTEPQTTNNAPALVNEVFGEDFTKQMQVCEFLASSTIIPEAYRGKPANVYIACQYGHALGLNPMVALSSVAVVNGKPCVYGDTLKALCMKHGKITETWNEELWEATCLCQRKGYADVEVKFSLKDALSAGLVGKGAKGELVMGTRKSSVWVQYPKRMIKMRARSYALRDAFPDILQGVITTEEANDYGDLKNA